MLLLGYFDGQMHPLLEKALLRVVFFYTYGLFVAWIFTLIEKTNESAQDKMKRTLLKLKEETYIKFNMTDNEFESLVTRAAAAVMEGDQLDWTFLNSCGFVFAALTTIGKSPLNIISNKFSLNICYLIHETQVKV